MFREKTKDSKIETKWIKHKGKKILFECYRNCDDKAAIIEGIRNTTSIILNYGKKDILLLMDIEGTPIFKETVEMLKHAGKVQEKYIKKNAVIGLSPAKMLFLKVFRKLLKFDIMPFETREDALEWLVKD